MLHIIFGEIDDFNKRYNTDYKLWRSINYLFDDEYNKDWLNNEWAKWVIKEVDKSTHVVDHIIESPYLGIIPPVWLSGGAKMLITMCNFNMHAGNPIIFNGDSMGNNCTEALTKLSVMDIPENTLNENLSNDIWMNLTYGMVFPETDQPVDVIFEGLNIVVDTDSRDLNKTMRYIYAEWNSYMEEVIQKEEEEIREQAGKEGWVFEEVDSNGFRGKLRKRRT